MIHNGSTDVGFICFRFLLEDGKLNLCLRNLIEYKDFQRRKWIVKEKLEVKLQIYGS